MNDLDDSERGERLQRLAGMLRDAPGITLFEDVFPRLDPGHLLAVADEGRTARPAAAELLTETARRGPSDQAKVAEIYRQRGELPALRRLVAPESVAAAALEWEREIQQLRGKAERIAALQDDEGVRCEGGETWVKRARNLRDRTEREFPDHPAAQKTLIDAFLVEMDAGLAQYKEQLRGRLHDAQTELDRNRHTLEDENVDRADEQAAAVLREIDEGNLLIALRKLAALEGLVRGGTPRSHEGTCGRLPLPKRSNPFGRGSFHFEDLISLARKGHEVVASRRLESYLPDHAIEEATQFNGFLQKHAKRGVPDWSPYFTSLREWLGLSESRNTRKTRRLRGLELPNLEPKGANLPGRWTFLEAEPWDGAPFYEGADGRPRILAVVRLAVSDEDRGRPQIVVKHAIETLRMLLGSTMSAVSEDERRFRDDGMVFVLLPGDLLSNRKYESVRREVQLSRTANLTDRIAYLDDLDLLRLVPVRADDRFRALLEVGLPRFPEALSQTYQNSDAVRTRMFFGRRDELARLKNGTTVVFSGRKMGKSSLLHRLRRECGPDTDQRAILVGCSGVARGRSWIVMHEIEREFARLLHQEGIGDGGPVGTVAAGLFDAPLDEAMQAAKDRFRTALDRVMRVLEERGIRQLYVLLDEADNFVRAEMEETSGERNPRSAVSWYLRDLQTSSYLGRLRFIFAGYDQIGRVFRDPGLGHSAFGNWGGPPLRLEPLDEYAARDLVVQPLTALGMTVGVDLSERILDYTSGHASLIQGFCRRLAERIRTERSDWPLEDVAVSFEDVQFVASDQRAGGDLNYRALLEQTLGLNLEVARAYPLKLLFLALVSPTGLGAGEVLGSGRFHLEDALNQVRMREGNSVVELSPTLVEDSLDLLAQLGLLDDVTGPQGREGRTYAFRARHYVNVLRSRNGFQEQLQQALDDWKRSGQGALQAEPRYVWTLPDTDLHALRRLTSRPSIIVGLPKTGRSYLAHMLASPSLGEDSAPLLRPADLNFRNNLDDRLAAQKHGLVVVLDPDSVVPWADVARWLSRAEEAGIPLRWVGGPRLAWDLAGDLEVAVKIDGPYSLGPLTAAELEPWTARELGDEGPRSGVSVTVADREPILRLTGGLLPVLELFREWHRTKHGPLPEPLQLANVEDYREYLLKHPARMDSDAKRISEGLPPELRAGLHLLFCETEDWGEEYLSRADLIEISSSLAKSGDDRAGRLLDTAVWLGVLRVDGATGQIALPQDSLLGRLIRSPKFASIPFSTLDVGTSHDSVI
jgi:hypothetical protein